MSENNEHSPDDTETETKATEDIPNDSTKSEVKLMMDRTDAALLEDEEMPTYISVSSISRRDNSSEVVNAKQPDNVPMEEEGSPSPYHSDDQAASSVYVLSSGEETDQLPYHDEDDEDEYGDSDDMENLELDHDSDPNHRNRIKHMLDEEDDDDDEEEDDDEDDNPRRMHNDDEVDDEYYDRISADVILNKELKKHDKEKSCSLQDLSIYRNNMYTDANRRRHAALTKRNYLNIPQNIVMFPMVRRKQQVSQKYHHVQSKVKLYIQDIKEQTRRSLEKHTKDREDAIHGKSNTECKNNDTEETKLVANRTIKSYAEKAIKELEIAEACEKDIMTSNALPIMLNGRDNKKNDLKSIQEEDIGAQVEIEISAPFELTQDKKDNVNSDDKKQNGISEVNLTEGETQQFGVTVQPSLVQNGHQGVTPVFFNLHTLSYDEYMRGTSRSSQKTDLNQNAQVIEQELTQSETYNDAEPMDVSKIGDNDGMYPVKIGDIRHINIMENEEKNNDEKTTFDRANEAFSKTPSDTSEVVTLKDQLNQKTIQYNNLRDIYHKQLAENLKMKQELEELRKSLAKYEKESKPPAQKIACIQTDFITETQKQTPLAKIADDKAQPINVKQHNNKISSSSVASTISSIEQWTDSTCNLSVSMKPPEAAKTLHSDDSIVLIDRPTPRKNSRTLSHAFITSSRILQTLSNITQGKAKLESPLVQNSKKRLNESTVMELQNDDGSYQSRPSSSKKRKIADVLGPSSFLQHFKVPQDDTESKLNETSNAERQFKYPYDSINERSESQENSHNNTSQLGTATPVENKTENINDPEDHVKCFVYHENENSTERSFLIQAEQPEKDKIVNEKTRTRECGPFLLGNVEVRMSEINGTINIWGKEINDESITENENEMETSAKVKSDKKCYCWQKTRLNGNNIVCSSSKKSKIPAKLEITPTACNTSCPHSMSFSDTPKAHCSTGKVNTDNACGPHVYGSTSEDCDFSKPHKEWLKYKRIHPEEKAHSCCSHNVETIGQKCSCFTQKEKQKLEDSCNCSKDKYSVKEHRQIFSNKSTPNKHLNEHVHPTTEDNEHTCGYHICHSPHDPRENSLEDHKRCNASMEASFCEQLKVNTDSECSGTCNYHSSNINEEEPLIAHKSSNETPETRRRRLSGKRVRNILMDFLRGCGDCYNPNAPSTSKSCPHKKETSYSMSCSPQIKISPCASAEQSCSNPGQSGRRCCHAYAQRIESQLEEFRVEMEKVRSRSDAILNMLNMLHSVDTD